MSKSRAKGTAWESRLVRYLRDHGFPNADRHPLRGTADRGDINGVPGWIVEAKHVASPTFLTWWVNTHNKCDPLADERAVVIWPRPHHVTDRALCVLDIDDFPYWGSWHKIAWRRSATFTAAPKLLDAARSDGAPVWLVRVDDLVVVELAVWCRLVAR